ncbi:hypothetical protein [Chroococcidiopsis sp.]|uniref:hypothetical protein n=1 Tax=Chroococcidiopsis sp. TaxID=3088168 RepID=UPI003F394C5B
MTTYYSSGKDEGAGSREQGAGERELRSRGVEGEFNSEFRASEFRILPTPHTLFATSHQPLIINRRFLKNM